MILVRHPKSSFFASLRSDDQLCQLCQQIIFAFHPPSPGLAADPSWSLVHYAIGVLETPSLVTVYKVSCLVSCAVLSEGLHP